MTIATPVLIAGNMCDKRLWPAAVRAVLPGAVDADTTLDNTIDGMARRALAAASGPLVPVGFSMGGIVALAMARLAPDRIAGLVLLDTNPSADLPERAAARPAQQEAVRAGELERVVLNKLLPHYFATANSGDVGLATLVTDMALALGEDVFVAQSEALRRRPDQRAVLPSLTVPVLIACGAEDRLCPPAWHQQMAAAAGHATLQVVEGAGHMLPVEHPEALARLIAAWLDEAVASGTSVPDGQVARALP